MTELVHITHGVWRPTEVAADTAGRVAAILSALPPSTVVCGWTAAMLHGLWLPTGTGWDRIEVVVRPDIALPRARGHNRRPELHVRRHTLLPDEVTTVDGIRLTSEDRTWLDLARVLGVADLVAAGDSALRGAGSVSGMSDVLSRATHRRGVLRARAALPLLDARSRSRPESHLRYVLVSAGLPKPDVNKPIYLPDGHWLAEPDLSYDDVRLALEYNGAEHADVNRMRRDITRGLDVSMGRWRTEVFGPIQVFRRPDQIVALVRVLRRERAGLFSGT